MLECGKCELMFASSTFSKSQLNNGRHRLCEKCVTEACNSQTAQAKVAQAEKLQCTNPECEFVLPRACFTKQQLEHRGGERLCPVCAVAKETKQARAAENLQCTNPECNLGLPRAAFSKEQLKRRGGKRFCLACIKKNTDPGNDMLECNITFGCGVQLKRADFPAAQLVKNINRLCKTLRCWNSRYLLI